MYNGNLSVLKNNLCILCLQVALVMSSIDEIAQERFQLGSMANITQYNEHINETPVETIRERIPTTRIQQRIKSGHHSKNHTNSVHPRKKGINGFDKAKRYISLFKIWHINEHTL